MAILHRTWHNHWHTIIQSHTITSIQSFNHTPWHNHWRTIIQPHTITQSHTLAQSLAYNRSITTNTLDNIGYQTQTLTC